MANVSNPFVEYLNRYTTASPDHEAAFDEFIAQASPPAGGPLRLNTRVATYLDECFAQPDPPSIILTGNAGDGKTYLCRQIVRAFAGNPIQDWEQFAEQPIQRGDTRLHVIKDLSELGTERGVAVLRELASAWEGTGKDRYLIAANEGRLRDLLGQANLIRLERHIGEQLQTPTGGVQSRLVVINLIETTTSSFVPEVLQWMTADEHWAACATCPIRDRCPVRHNAARLRDPHIAGRVQFLYQLLEHLDIHVTVRDMLIHLAYTLTGDKSCLALQQLDARQGDRSVLAYYRNVWGGGEGSAFARKASVVRHLKLLRIGEHSLFDIDEFIVGGADSAQQEAHARLFAPTVDLDFRRFEQDRKAYIEGGAEGNADKEASTMLKWLPHCRSKLFFEGHEERRVNQLVAFRHLEAYLRLLNDDQESRDHVLAQVVLGLNRGFSRLYLNDSTMLYVTSQVLHSAEQSRPLIRLAIPISGLSLELEPVHGHLVDRAWPSLTLRIGAPPALLRHDPSAAERPQIWRINLLLFEYVMRLAYGGTYNVLAEECELSLRNLKDRLLSAYARAPAANDVVEFFVAERRRYTIKKLRIDERGIVRRGG